MKKIQSVRGMKDVLPSDCKIYSGLENLLSSSASQFGYREIRTPILEDSELFIKTIGNGTDIVEKEMYTFVDSKKNSYSMRPEGTASCARAIIQGGLANTINKIWYCGPFFRHERPQKGRYRQFHQFGAEYIGVEGFEADVEIVLLADSIWKKLKIKPRLKVNTIGNHEERKKYISKLQDYFSKHQDILSEDEKIKMEKNPLRILDSKNQNIIDLLKQCPKINEFISKDSRNHFEKFLKGLDKNKICFERDDNLVRGLDYYNRTVFEYLDNSENSQNTICAGGRYDYLFENMFNKKIPALGFAIGIERLLDYIDNQVDEEECINFYVIILKDKDYIYAQNVADEIRNYSNAISVVLDYSYSNLKVQLKKANKLNSNYCIIIGENESKDNSVQIKNMNTGNQESVSVENIASYLKTELSI